MPGRWTISQKSDGTKTVMYYDPTKRIVKDCGSADKTIDLPMVEHWVLVASMPGDILYVGGRVHFKMPGGVA